jgi:hypothetical protein
MRIFINLLILNFLFVGCASQEQLNTQLDPSWSAPNMKEYKKVVAKNTHQVRKYDGFYNKFDISITKLNQDIRIKQLKIKANYSQWTKEKADKERQKLVESMSEESVFFVSSFTPKRDYNNLTMKDIGWTATLEVDGVRHEGVFKAYTKQPFKLESLYEHHTIWHRGFILKFPISSELTDNKPQVITLTSPFGYAIYAYK